MPADRHIRVPVLGRAVAPFGSDFVSLEAASGIALLLATIAALVWSNVASTGYADFWHREVTIGVGNFSITEDLLRWVNDGLMTVFFFVVGLEIKRELVVGELRDRRTAVLPAIAALGGMVVPALLYFALNVGGAGSRGWAIPMATDIAFAVGVLTILRTRVPRGLKVFLLSLAIVDDIGAIVVIALFYSRGIDGLWLMGAVAAVLVVVTMSRLSVDHPVAYLLPGFLLWLCLLEAGVEATLAGVVLGLLTPALPRNGRAVLPRLEHGLHPVSSFVIVPLFALANAGVALTSDALDAAFRSRITIGIVVGLVIGKFIGIMGASTIAVRARVGRLPEGIGMRHVAGVGALGGIGFTVALFVSDLSFTGQRLADAKLGVFAATLIAAVFGVVLLTVLLHPRRTESG